GRLGARLGAGARAACSAPLPGCHGRRRCPRAVFGAVAGCVFGGGAWVWCLGAVAQCRVRCWLAMLGAAVGCRVWRWRPGAMFGAVAQLPWSALCSEVGFGAVIGVPYSALVPGHGGGCGCAVSCSVVAGSRCWARRAGAVFGGSAPLPSCHG